MKTKLTPWFSGDQKPVRVGVYQRKSEFGVVYAYWDGNFWGRYAIAADNAPRIYSDKDRSALQKLPWRGVMK